MFRNISLYVMLILFMVALGAQADDVKSFSKQMNEIKRSGDYIYAESSATSEDEAKTACDGILKIEITKYLASANTQSQAEARIVKNIADYNCEYLVQPRGGMTRVFGYVAKKDILKCTKDNDVSVSEKKVEQKDNGNKGTKIPKEVRDEMVLQRTPSDASSVENAGGDEEVVEPVTQFQGKKLNTEGLQLAKWQVDLLESIVKEPDMMQAKKRLNRFKYQNRIKRLGNESVSNPRPTDSFFLIYGKSGKPVALLAPSTTNEHYNMLSGTTDNFDNYSGNKYFWFQISK